MTKQTKSPSQIFTPVSLLAVAACAMTLTVGSHELQLMPAGSFAARDGRPKEVASWVLDAAIAQSLIAAANARTTPYVIDYDHQTILSKTNGQPAPAAGWFKTLEWREGVGLFATDVQWTERATSLIAADEYKFISPVIGYDKTSGAVNALLMAAITNNPAIGGMDEVLLSAAALHFTLATPAPLTTMEKNTMEDLVEQLRWMLNLPVGSTADDVKAQLQKLIDLIKEDPSATAATSFDLPNWIKAQRTAVASLSTHTPDPAKYVGIAVMQDLQSQLTTLSAEVNTGRLNTAIAKALSTNKLLPAQEAWAREWGAKDLTALSSYLENVPSILALAGLQTGGKAPVESASALTASQVAMCSATGITEADFLKTLQSEPQA